MLATLLLTLVGYGLLVLRPAARILLQFHQQMLAREADLAAATLDGLTHPVVDRAGLRETLQRVFEPAPNLSVAVFRSDGEVLGMLRRPAWAPGSPAGLAAALRDLAAGGARSIPGAPLRPPMVLRRLGNDGPPTFVLVTAERHGRDLVHQRYPGLWLRSLVLLVGLTGAAALLALRLFTGRLTRLRQGLERLAEGDYRARVDPGIADEVGDLLRAFNATAEKLQAATDEVERQARARREMLADVSHELRTPLTTLRGHLELLQEDRAGLDEAQARSLAVAHEEALALGQRIEDLLTLAREETGHLTLELAPLDLVPFLAQLGETFRALCADRGLELTTALGDAPVVVRADPSRLAQVVRNLLENALMVLSRGDRVTLRLVREPDAACLEVEDTGPGIEPAAQATLFDRFQRGEGRRGAGTGLGLAIARRLVERHGGTCTVESTVGQGSCFRVRLPAPLEDLAVPAPAEEAPSG